jgi:hypothetical protein
MATKMAALAMIMLVLQMHLVSSQDSSFLWSKQNN